jgi:hypothetical protein
MIIERSTVSEVRGCLRSTRPRRVDDLLHRSVRLREVLPDAVENHDGVVDRVADDRQQRGDHRQVHLELEPADAREREAADRDQHVVHDAEHGREPVAELRSAAARR